MSDQRRARTSPNPQGRLSAGLATTSSLLSRPDRQRGFQPGMIDRLHIRAAGEADARFVAGFVSSLLEFASPAWNDTEALGPGFAPRRWRARCARRTRDQRC